MENKEITALKNEVRALRKEYTGPATDDILEAKTCDIIFFPNDGNNQLQDGPIIAVVHNGKRKPCYKLGSIISGKFMIPGVPAKLAESIVLEFAYLETNQELEEKFKD